MEFNKNINQKILEEIEKTDCDTKIKKFLKRILIFESQEEFEFTKRYKIEIEEALGGKS